MSLIEQHIDDVERYAALYMQTGQEHYFDLVQKAKTALKEAFEVYRSINERKNEALKDIIAIAEPHAEFTAAYEKICDIARKGLG